MSLPKYSTKDGVWAEYDGEFYTATVTSVSAKAPFTYNVSLTRIRVTEKKGGKDFEGWKGLNGHMNVVCPEDKLQKIP